MFYYGGVPLISVIIPTLNEGKYIHKLIKQLKQQTIKPDEIIVVDGDSEDDTVKKAKGAKIIKTYVRSPAHQRNLGAKKAKGKYLLFVDADMTLPKNTIEQLLHDIQGGVCANPYLSVEKPWFSYLIFVEPANFFTRFFPSESTRGGCILVKKSAFKKVGGFNEQMSIGEDLELGRRLRKVGKVKTGDIYVFESPRRYKQKGMVNVVLEWWINGLCARLFGKTWHDRDVVR